MCIQVIEKATFKHVFTFININLFWYFYIPLKFSFYEIFLTINREIDVKETSLAKVTGCLNVLI